MNAEPRKRSQGLTLLLYLLIITYLLGAVFLFMSYQGLQSFNDMAWRRDTMPFYAFLALVGAGAAYAVLKWRRAGVYALAFVWVATGFLNLVFVRPISYSSLLFGVLVVVAFFLLLLPSWKYMK